MIKEKIVLAMALGTALSAKAQTDTVEVKLEEVIVKAFEQNRKLRDIPAAVNYLGQQAINRFAPNSLVAAVNATPGVRMEERSPGSYRFNIRGSSLRSPFGVRNVKIYYNDLPYTDPGGHSYLNQMGFYNFNSLEIIKGPGSSLYGAGTGGVMLIESLDKNAVPSVTAGYTTGSYNLQNAYASLTTGTDNVTTRTTYQHFESDGYRDHSSLRRDVLSWNGIFQLGEKRELKTSFLYSDVFYETPGALNISEYNSNPKAARPTAVSAKAALGQKTFIAGASYTQELLPWLSNKSILYGAFTELRNPNARGGYDRSSEPHAGGRSVFTAQKSFSDAEVSINAGAEWQQGFGTASSFKNVSGNADSIRYFDDIANRQSFLFAQATLDVNTWSLTAGVSWNQLKIRAERFDPAASGEQKLNFDNELAPRVSVLKKFENITVYSSVAKGFSPPTTGEFFPTGGTYNLNLQPEQGINYDLGARATFFNKLYVDVNAFIYSLKNTIVRRVDTAGGDFYTNAGQTEQYGIEAYLSYPLFSAVPSVKRSLIWTSYTWHNFHYKDFKGIDDDFSGKRMPGEAQHTLAAGIDFATTGGLQANLTYLYSDATPLNDANTAFADAFHLLGLKLGYQFSLKRLPLTVFAGVENLLDEQYSLGNDINPQANGRYYNAAPGRNYYGGVSFSFLTKKKEG